MESDKIFIPFELNEEDAQLYSDTATDPDVNFFQWNLSPVQNQQ